MNAGVSTNPLRQQMINMMYLVLTALLALNVSADILKAFALVNKGLGQTNDSYQQKNDLTMAQFSELMKVDKRAAQQYYNNAINARTTSDKMYQYLQGIKDNIASRSGGWVDAARSTVDNDQNMEVSTRYFLNEGHGNKLRDSLKMFITNMKSYLDKPGAVAFKIDVDDPPAEKDGTKKDWTSYYWEGVPSVAAVTELTKLQNDVRNAEAEVTNYNINAVGLKDFKFKDLKAVINSETPVLVAGQNYNARIFLGAVSATIIPKVTVNGVPQKVENGEVDYHEPVSSSGSKTLNVAITVPNPNNPGHDTTYTTKTQYTVFGGASTIAAEKMNTLYIGLENPIAVSAAGFTPQQTTVRFSGGGVLSASAPGHYNFKPDGSAREVEATCFVKMQDGTTRKMGDAIHYKIRKVPKPEVFFGTKSSGSISKGEAIAVRKIYTSYAETFAFDGLTFKVNSFTLAISTKNGPGYIEPISGSELTANARNKLQGIHPGDLIIIGNVDCTGPGGSHVVLGGTNLAVR